MRTIIAAAAALAVMLAGAGPAGAQKPDAEAAGRAFAPDGLSTLPSEYRIPGGRPLLFCGEKFMVVLIVGFVHQEQGVMISVKPPTLQAIRKGNIDGVQLALQSGARIQFRDPERRSIDTWTDARAILECLD